MSALAFLSTAGPAFAEQQAPDPDVAGKVGASALAEVVVTATRSAQSADKIGSSVTVLTTPRSRPARRLPPSTCCPRPPA